MRNWKNLNLAMNSLKLKTIDTILSNVDNKTKIALLCRIVKNLPQHEEIKLVMEIVNKYGYDIYICSCCYTSCLEDEVIFCEECREIRCVKCINGGAYLCRNCSEKAKCYKCETDGHDILYTCYTCHKSKLYCKDCLTKLAQITSPHGYLCKYELYYCESHKNCDVCEEKLVKKFFVCSEMGCFKKMCEGCKHNEEIDDTCPSKPYWETKARIMCPEHKA